MKSIILITMVALALAGPAVPKQPETEQVAAGSLDGQEKAISEATLRLIALNQQMQKLQANSGLTRAATGQRASNNPLASIPILGQLIDLLLSILNGSLLNTGGDTDGETGRSLSDLLMAGQAATGNEDGQQQAIADAITRLLALQESVKKIQASPDLTRAAYGQRASNNPLASIPILGQLIDLLLSILNGSLLNTGGDAPAESGRSLNLPSAE